MTTPAEDLAKMAEELRQLQGRARDVANLMAQSRAWEERFNNDGDIDPPTGGVREPRRPRPNPPAAPARRALPSTPSYFRDLVGVR